MSFDIMLNCWTCGGSQRIKKGWDSRTNSPSFDPNPAEFYAAHAGCENREGPGFWHCVEHRRSFPENTNCPTCESLGIDKGPPHEETCECKECSDIVGLFWGHYAADRDAELKARKRAQDEADWRLRAAQLRVKLLGKAQAAAKKVRKTCHSCQNNRWDCNPIHYSMMRGEALIVQPYVPMVCTHCGEVFFFDAIQLGIIDPDTRELIE